MRTIFTFCCLLLTTAAYSTNPPSTLNITFGKGNNIVYDLNKGSYTVTFSTDAGITDAYALAKGNASVNDSRQFTFIKETESNVNDALGKGKKYVIYRKGTNGQQMQQLFWVYTGKNYFFTSVIVSGASNYNSPLVTEQFHFNKTGDNRALFVPFDNDMWVRYDAHELASASFTSSEASAIYNSDNYNGIVIGSIEHEVWKTGIRIDAGQNGNMSLSAFGGYADSVVTHDKKAHGFVVDQHNNSVSPRIMVGYFDDWRKGMETYADNNRIAEPPAIFNWKDATPMGWNSWGVLQAKLTQERAEAVVSFLHDSCPGFRNADNTLFIDLDAFWNKMLPNGLDGDLGPLKAFVDFCNARGFKPGVYWTPWADWGKRDRKVEGSNYMYSECWTKVNGKTIEVDGGRAVDPTHPAILRRIDHDIDKLKAVGFKMVKIDFLGHGALEADSFYDKNVHTGMQAYKKGMDYLVNRLGNSMLVYAAISPSMATARYVHMRRIACDAFKKIDETAYTLNSTTYGWWLSRMYNFSDADHVVFDDMSDGENRARLASAMVTGTLITGDDYSSDGKWKQTAETLLQNKQLLSVIGHDGKSFTPIEVNTGKNASRIFTKVIGQQLYIAVFNYSDAADNIQDLPALLAKSHLTIEGSLKNILDGKEVMATALAVPAKDAAVYEVRLKP